MKEKLKKAKNKVRDDQEKGAQKELLRQLFNDFHTDRLEIYKINFFRGIFFGLGSVLGGTVLIALMIFVVSQLADSIPFLSDFFRSIQLLLETATK